MARIFLSGHEHLGGESSVTEVEKYLTELDARLNVGHKERVAILNEVHDHLLESVQRFSTNGKSRIQAESEAVSAFGSLPLIVSQFNANAGAKAMRRAPAISVTAGVAVVALFLLAVIGQPNSIAPATVYQQVTFFLSVISFQFYIVAGACGLFRALAIWNTSPSLGRGRAYVRRCVVISMTALMVGILTMSANFILEVHRTTPMHRVPLIFGALSMFLAAGGGLLSSIKLRVNPSFENLEVNSIQPHLLFTLGESALNVIRRYPVRSVAVATIVATAWVMFHAENSSLVGALPWGIAEAVFVLCGFFFLGPALELRTVELKPKAQIESV
jgi:hypothetical protein